MANHCIISRIPVAALMATSIGVAVPVSANTEVETAELLIKLVQVGRGPVRKSERSSMTQARATRIHGRLCRQPGDRTVPQGDQDRLESPHDECRRRPIPALGGIREGSDR